LRFAHLLTVAAVAAALSVTACAPEIPPVSDKVSAAYEAGKSLPPATTRPVAVFIGDSYAQGRGASSEAANWVALVAKAEGWGYDNLGKGGTGYVTVSDVKGCGLPVCPNYQDMANAAIASKPHAVVVAGGQNDFAAFLADPIKENAAIRATFAKLRAGLPDALIVAVGPSTPWVVDSTVVEMDQAVQDAAAAVKAKYVSLIEPNVISPDMVLGDKVHVNDDGHKAIAERVEAALR
jgi:lysophospholipase L1-like esterase